MATGISQALAWCPGEIEAFVSEVRADIAVIEQLAGRLRNESDRTLDGMSGHSIQTIRHSLDGLRGQTFGLEDELRGAADPLDSFAHGVEHQLTRLRASVAAVHRLGGSVGEDGTVTPPAHTASRPPLELAALEGEIRDALREIDRLDAECADALLDYCEPADMSRAVPTDPSTAIAGFLIRTHTDSLAELIDSNPDGLRATGAVAKGLGPFGSALSLAAGIAGAPDDESMTETLIAEGGGIALGSATALGVTIAAAPLLGAAGGVLAGAALAAGVGYGASLGIRALMRSE